MKKELNTIILEKGDSLYRYDLGDCHPAEWSICHPNPEYLTKQYGPKNQIGAFFFFDKESTAKQVLSQAVVNQEKKGINYSKGTITSCEVTDSIVLLDLETDLIGCSNIISVLYELDLNVISNKFYNFQKKQPFEQLKEAISNLYSDQPLIKLSAANEINEFFCSCPPYLGQLLTDFKNGIAFKALLEMQGYEGYVFMEQFSSNTYCLLSSDKISPPRHQIIDIDTNMEIQDLIRSIKGSCHRL